MKWPVTAQVVVLLLVVLLVSLLGGVHLRDGGPFAQLLLVVLQLSGW